VDLTADVSGHAHAEEPFPRPISLLIVDGHAPYRAGIRAAVEAAGFVVTGEAADAATAIAVAVATKPDICLVDIDVPGSGLNVVAAVARRSPGTTIIVLTESSDSGDLLASLERGASGYLLKTIASEELARTLRATTLGEPALSRTFVTALINQVRSRPPRRITLPDGAVELTVREWDVAELLRDGLNTVQISERLGLSPVTVRRHVASMSKKLGAPDRTVAIRMLKTFRR
jgi:DNA-binding NarL/FixJ family response regulator